MKKFALIIVLLYASIVLGADVKISALPLGTASSTSATDSFPFVYTLSGVTKRLTLYDIANLPPLVARYSPLLNPSFSGNGTFTGTVTASGFVGPISGTAATATAFDHNPTDCAGGAYAIQIDAGGNLTCASVAFSQLTGSIAPSQIPAPTTSLKGGVLAYSAPANQFLTAITTTGAPTSAQPAFSNISGVATGAQLPNPSSSSLGGVQSAAAVTNQWINSISTAGVPALSQPAFPNLSGSVAATQMPALTGDATTAAGTTATTVSKINGTSLGGLSTGILKNTTSTGVPSIAVAADFPTLNQSTTGNAATATLATTATTAGNVSGIVATANGGTGLATTLTFPTTGTVDTTTGVYTLTNKSLTDPVVTDAVRLAIQSSSPAAPAAGYKKFYPKTDGKLYTQDAAGLETAVGSGGSGGAGRVNFLVNGDAETGTAGWVQFKGTAQATPSTVTTGTPSFTHLGVTLTNPIDGVQSFTFTSGTANYQGEGASRSFTVPAAYVSTTANPQTMEFSFPYTVTGTLTSSDVLVGIYDVTTSTIVSSGYILPTVTSYVGYFTPTSSTDTYAAFYYMSSTSAANYVVTFDDVIAGPLLRASPAVYAANVDSNLQINGFSAAFGSTATKVFSFTSGTVINNIGDAIQYVDDSVNGARFTCVKDGIFSFASSWYSGASGSIPGLSKNSVNLTTGYPSIPLSEKLISSGNAAASSAKSISWTGPLKAGDVIRFHDDSSTSFASTNSSSVSVSYIGSVKQITSVKDQKINLPSSEIFFSDASARGSTDTTIVKYTTMTNLRGDAFSVVNSAANGTVLTMVRDGVLSIGASVYSSAALNLAITRNQAVLSSFPVATDIVATSHSYASDRVFASWQGKVFAGDKFRISTDQAVSSNATGAMLQAFFTESTIPISINTAQPIWSQSDSTSQVNTTNGAGSTGTATVRFSNVVQNLGSDITYVPSAVSGDSWIINSAGTYSVSTTLNSTAAEDFGVSVNSPNLTLVTISLPLANQVLTGLMAAGAQGGVTLAKTSYFNAGDIIRVNRNGGTSANPSTCQFTISKVGKPNLTAADVTSFVNIPQQDFETASNTGGTGSTGIVTFSGTPASTNKGYLTVTSTRVTALKPVTVHASWAWQANNSASNTITMGLWKNGVNYFGGGNAPGPTYSVSASAPISLNAGDYLEFYGTDSRGLQGASYQLLAYGTAPTIVSASKQVSSDTMTFAFKSTAINSATDPVGTFNTYTYATSNVKTIAATAPTQTTSSMSTNGIQVFARPNATASTAASPAWVDVFVGTGLKSQFTNGYGGTAKTLPFAYNHIFNGASTEYGTNVYYNEVTGILTIEAAQAITSASNRWVDTSTLGIYSSGYFVFNASANPALLSVPALVPRIAFMKDMKASGTDGGSSSAGVNSRNLNTLSDPTGIIQNPSSFTGVGGTNTNFTLAPGTYDIAAWAPTNSGLTTKIKLDIYNVTDSVYSIYGESSFSSANGTNVSAHAEDIITITKMTTFRIDHYVSAAQTTNGLGANATTGRPEVYARARIQKLY